MTKQTERQDAKDLVALWFQDPTGEPFQLTVGQADIFNSIFLRKHPRNQIIAPTRYGKSDVVSMALILRSMTFKESWTILAPSSGKAQVIMGKLIGHLFDNPALEAQIDHSSIPQSERLKHKRNVEHITWLNGGEIRTVTADANNRKRVKDALTGLGATNLVADEAVLIPNDLWAMCMRMLGDSQDNFLLKIANPFLLNHFHDSSLNPKYEHTIIDYKQGLAEGRYSEEYIDEMRYQPFFRELYECRFPDESEFLDGGYQRLITSELLHEAMYEDGEPIQKPQQIEQPIVMGCDFAGGGNDRSAYVVRTQTHMWLETTNSLSNLIDQADIVVQLKNKYGIEETNIHTDAGGLGQGVGDYLHREIECFTNNVNFGQSAQDKTRFKNARAEMYYRLAEWIRNGGKIVYDENFLELLSVAFKTDSERKFQIQAKQELKKRMSEQGLDVSSPDVADAACLTFASATVSEDEKFFIF